MTRLLPLLFLSPFVFAENKLFEKAAECSALPDNKQLVVKSSIKSLKKEWEELTENVTSKALARAFEELKRLDSDYQVEHIFFEKITEDKSGVETKHVKARLLLNAVKDCKQENRTIASNEVHKLNTLEFNIGNASTLTLNISPPLRAKRELKLNDTSISNEKVFGAKFGQSFESVEAQYGRFSLVWPLGKNKLALLGRNHAFYFENNALSGYRYSSSLLPVPLNNKIEIVSENVSLEVKNGDAVNLADGISESELKSLKQEFKHLEFLSVGDAINNETILKVESLAIGKVNFGLSKLDLSCINANNISELPNLDSLNLIDFFDQKGKRNLLSGCNQQFVFSARGHLRAIELLEPWSVNNSMLFASEPSLNAFGNWRLFGLEKDVTLKQLKKLGKINVFMGVAEFSSSDGGWSGNFYLDDNRLVSGEIEVHTF
ncbi:hypothetical protein CWB73_17760 [Pseudoalteromonas phenolica]|uniref:Uncharacterized protein n=1 Tax=Pseudoalteromonas phenolica TaxID=161398 RepID=A0A5S3YQC3_9GAMM|nr:hypothetical protein [Pseudoalteromonas phenolica]TMP78090.1 hypothetical protein CWB73_17760 [Pseudoalteromonas phenolica]